MLFIGDKSLKWCVVILLTSDDGISIRLLCVWENQYRNMAGKSIYKVNDCIHGWAHFWQLEASPALSEIFSERSSPVMRLGEHMKPLVCQGSPSAAPTQNLQCTYTKLDHGELLLSQLYTDNWLHLKSALCIIPSLCSLHLIYISERPTCRNRNYFL